MNETKQRRENLSSDLYRIRFAESEHEARGKEANSWAREDSPQCFHDGCFSHKVVSNLLPLRIVHAQCGDLFHHHLCTSIPTEGFIINDHG